MLYWYQMSAILEKLESKNIFHGNINPIIFMSPLTVNISGGFSDFESKIDDMSFIAPEIFRKGNTDFTTDIYSRLDYVMSNQALFRLKAMK